jgi:dihydrofolate reductase
MGLRPFELARAEHGLSGGATGPDDEIVQETVARTGATVMGRRMFSGGEGLWEDDPNRDGWWGDEPPFHGPVFVLTHHPRKTVQKQGGTTFSFVTDGIEAAQERARAAAGDRDVAVAGEANAVQQYLRAGLVDKLQFHVVPLLLGDGVRLFDALGEGPRGVKVTRMITSPAVTHLRYSVVK